MIVIATCWLVTLGYALLMYTYHRGWVRQQVFSLPRDYKPSVFISVVIPARNEGKNIGTCLESILAQKYPLGLFEVIVVDDHSEDDTVSVVSEYEDRNVRCVRLSQYLGGVVKINAYKKAALAAGIASAKGALIVTTDADCIVPNAWLMHIAAIYEQQNPVLIAAPVIYSPEYNVVQVFQLIDFMSMQGITAAAHALKLGNMSNGANLAFTKAAYNHVEGYKGTDHLASGDDLLLMVKMQKAFPGRIAYLKSRNAVVVTSPQPTWGAFIQQRIRWASKSGKYDDARLTTILIFVYLFNALFIALAIAGIWDGLYLQIAGGMLVAKVLAELLFLWPVARFFKDRWALRYFPFLQPLHIVYITLTGFMGFLGNYKWKGRQVR